VKSTPASLGHKFRTDVLDKFEPDSVAALILLDRAAATLDEVCLLAEALERDGALVEGEQRAAGRASGAEELRAHREAFPKLAREREPNAAPAAREAASTLARKRWDR
jgi:hypothetical protein